MLELYQLPSYLSEIVKEMEVIATEELLNEEEKENQIKILMAKYEGIEGVRDNKALDLCRQFKNFQSSEKAITDEIKALTTRRNSYRNKANYIKIFLANIVPLGDKIEDSTAKISWRKSEILIYDETQVEKLPEEFVSFEPKVDKRGLKEFCKENGDTELYHTETNQSIQLK